MNNNQTLKTLFIDWDGTLSNSRFWDHFTEGKHSSIYGLIQNDFFPKHKDFLLRWMRGGETAESCATLLSKITKQDPVFLLDQLRISCENMLFVSPEIPNLIYKLRSQGVCVIIATDNMNTFNRWTIPAMKLNKLFDGILNSNSLKCLKSDILPTGESAFFSKYLKENNLINGECLLLDNSVNAKIVEKFGINFIQITKDNDIVSVLQELTSRPIT